MNYRFRRNILGFARGKFDWIDDNDAGSQALTGLGQKAQAGAKMLYEFLTTHFGRAGSAENPARTIGKPAQNTLFPADLTAPWRGSPARKEPEPRRPA